MSYVLESSTRRATATYQEQTEKIRVQIREKIRDIMNITSCKDYRQHDVEIGYETKQFRVITK